MINRFYLRAKWTRNQRKGKFPAEKPVLVPKPGDIPVSLHQYLLAQVHLAQTWTRGQFEELGWFLASMRGELPPRIPVGVYVHHVFLPHAQYLRALEALTTRLGVKLP